MADRVEPLSPLWWTLRLEKALKERRSQIALFDSYYQGDHPLAFASQKFLEAFGGLFEAFADNWCQLVVDGEEERLHVEGFRFGDTKNADQDAWAIWQANGLDSASGMAHTDALVMGETSAIVWAGPDREPLITVEHPNEVLVEYVAGSRTLRAAAIKVFTDMDGAELATLYLPDGVYKWRRSGRSGATSLFMPSGYGTFTSAATSWVPREVPGETWPLANPLGVVPVVPLRNRPRLLVPCMSELRGVIPVQAGVNKLVADMLVASEFAAYRQRWATGMDIPVDPETNQPIEAFKMAVSRFMIGEDPETRFGDLSATDLENFVKAIELLVQHIASQTRTPPHYFYLSGQFPSGESIKSAETGLVAKSARQAKHFGEAWEEIVRLGFAVKGDKRSTLVTAETIWGDMESRSESEHVDALVKLSALGVPNEILWERAGFGPTEILRMKAMIAEEKAAGETEQPVTIPTVGTAPATDLGPAPPAPAAPTLATAASGK